MTAADLATAGFIEERFQFIVSYLQQLTPAPAPAQAEVVLYSISKLAAVLDVHPDTVREWVNVGKKKKGRLLKLRAFRFTSEARIPWPALLAFERGEDFDLATLPAPVLAPPAELTPAPLPKRTSPPDPPGTLRVA